jgi:hypothetical protein
MRRALLLLACTVDLGAVPDGGACAPSPDFFVSDVAPLYLEANRCGLSGCHDFATGHGTLRLRPPAAPPAAGTPLADWPLSWRENYFSTIHLLRCDAPLASRLLTMPEGVNNLHPPGPVVRDRATAALVIQTWVTAP